MEDDKTKAVATCENCGDVVPVRVWSDGSIHEIGGNSPCCADRTLRLIDGDDEMGVSFPVEESATEETGD